MSVRDLVDRTCIAGVGATPQGKLPGHSGDDLAVWAIREALVDAGIRKSEIDALIVQRSFGGQGDVRDVGHRLAIAPPLAFNIGYQGEALLIAIMLVANGLAEVAGLAYGTNQRTNRNTFASPALHVGGNFEAVYGLASPASTAAFSFRRRMHDYGATEEQLGALVVAQSKAAALNPLAVYRGPISTCCTSRTPTRRAPSRCSRATASASAARPTSGSRADGSNSAASCR